MMLNYQISDCKVNMSNKNKSNFKKNVLTLMAGTTIAQAIPIGISPVLTRMYTPDDFGVLAVFSSLVMILGAIANGRYELAIGLPEKEEDSLNIAALCLLLSSGLSFILMVIVIFFSKEMAILLGNTEIEKWLYFVPVIVFFTGLFNVLNYYNTRIKNYKRLSKAIILKSVLLASVQLLGGVVHSGVAGLISGQSISAVVPNIILFFKTIRNKMLMKTISFKRIKIQAQRYNRFPKYSLGAIFANTLSRNLLNIIISSVFSSSILGFYYMGQRVLGLPSALIGNSIGQVFFQTAIKEKQATGKAIKIYKSTMKKLLVIAVPGVIVGSFLLESIFALFLGEEWRIAGEYAVILLPLFALRFISAPVSNINNVFEKQTIALMWQIGLLVITVGSVVIAFLFKMEFTSFLYFYSGIVSLHYLLLIIITYKVSSGEL